MSLYCSSVRCACGIPLHDASHTCPFQLPMLTALCCACLLFLLLSSSSAYMQTVMLKTRDSTPARVNTDGVMVRAVLTLLVPVLRLVLQKAVYTVRTTSVCKRPERAVWQVISFFHLS